MGDGAISDGVAAEAAERVDRGDQVLGERARIRGLARQLGCIERDALEQAVGDPDALPEPRLVRHGAQALGERRPECRVASQRMDHLGPRLVKRNADHGRGVPLAMGAGAGAPSRIAIRLHGQPAGLREPDPRCKCIDSRRPLA